ncbi:protein DOWN-REGULATED IN DIF1 11-like [Telopea speciosissima]|uniref:protein DOWN-REGULATED IN DIF1 11-like n=1 Tax=Telopea speciosissima TaxID=54955 RepID=UPI001CC64ED3|nr:protein DOWN-REGULATED IN DIF1 11-like [Telopea speciosissima]
MANFYGISMIIIVFLAFKGMVIVPVLASRNITPAPAPELDSELPIPPEPRPGYYHYLDTCTKHIHDDKCGLEIIKGLDGKGKVSKDCCLQLVEMGYDCHIALVEALGLIAAEDADPAYPKFEQFNEGLPKTGPEVWNQCVKDTVSPPLPLIN